MRFRYFFVPEFCRISPMPGSRGLSQPSPTPGQGHAGHVKKPNGNAGWVYKRERACKFYGLSNRANYRCEKDLYKTVTTVMLTFLIKSLKSAKLKTPPRAIFRSGSEPLRRSKTYTVESSSVKLSPAMVAAMLFSADV